MLFLNRGTLYRTLIAVACLLATAQFALAKDSFDQSSLNQLETKFFEHTYPQDTSSNRLDRLEKMIFGETRQGSDSDRLSALLKAVPQSSSDNQIAAADNQATPPLASETPQSAPPAPGDTDTSDDDPNPAPGGDKYPRVGQLEKFLLGNVYAAEPIRQRLDQLEIKAFGKASTNTDLSDRVDRLEDYAEKRQQGAGRRLASTNPAFDMSQEPAASEPVENKVSWLEMQILGHTSPHTPMIERLRPLEKAMFPTEPADIHASIPEQVNMLVAAVELLSKQQQGAAPDNQDLSYQPLMNRQQQPQPAQAYSNQPGYAGYPSEQGSSPPSYVKSYNRGYAQQGQPVAYGAGPQPQSSYAYGSTAPQAGAPLYQQGQQPATARSASNQSKGHPFLKGLAHVLGEVGQMAVGSMGSGMMMPGGYYGGYPSAGVFGWP